MVDTQTNKLGVMQMAPIVVILVSEDGEQAFFVYVRWRVQGVCFVSPISPVWSAVQRLTGYCQQQLTRTLLLSEQIEFCVTSVIPTVLQSSIL